MDAPKTDAGYLTEAIMRRITAKVGTMKAHQYNPIWSTVLAVLEEELPPIFAAKAPLSRKEFLKARP